MSGAEREDERVFTRRAEDVVLAELLQTTGPGDERWCFTEGPTEAGFRDAAVRPDAALVARLWSVRLFGEADELAARRLSFRGAAPWQVRWCGRGAPPGGSEAWRPQVVAQEAPTECRLALFGQTDDDHRSYAPADAPESTAGTTRRAPGVPRAEDVRLLVRSVRMADGRGAIQRWVEVVAGGAGGHGTHRGQGDGGGQHG